MSGSGRDPKHPLTQALAYFRDLGFRELFVEKPATEEKARPTAVTTKTLPERRASQPVAVTPAVVEPVFPSAVPSPGTALSPEERMEKLERLCKEVSTCQKCPLSQTRKQTVFSDGSPKARLMFIGEAPGADEDAQGIPFVGRAGQLLSRMIEGGMGLSRQDVYIANVLKCRPPDNRNPEPAEIAQCRGYLESQIELVKPEVIVALGNFGAQFLLETKEGIMRLHGKWASYKGIPVMPTFHPSFLLRSPEKKKEAWQDLILVLKKLDLPVPGPGSR